MENYTTKELEDARKVILSIISRCEKMQPKFEAGTSSHTLLKNRIKALYISKSLLSNENITEIYTIDDLKNALPPVTSIIHKTEKAQGKYTADTSQYKRFSPTINAMYISKALIEEALIEAELYSRGE